MRTEPLEPILWVERLITLNEIMKTQLKIDMPDDIRAMSKEAYAILLRADDPRQKPVASTLPRDAARTAMWSYPITSDTCMCASLGRTRQGKRRCR